VDQKEPISFRVERITASHDVTSFSCHNTFLEMFLRNQALVETNRDQSLTFLLLDNGLPSSIVGYFTLRADSFYLSPGSISGNRVIPVVELMYLARDISRRGQGIGDYLLIEAFRNITAAASLVGIGGLQLAFTAEGKRLYDRYGFTAHPYGDTMLFISINVVRQVVAEADAEI
jgi:ribosomal protein S18 acetylase RimI-like enzyme